MTPALFASLLALQAAAPAAASADPPELADLKRAWEQSCADRAYGTFDDVCTQMSDQIRAYERDLRRAERRRPAPAAAPAVGGPAAAGVANSGSGKG